MCACGGTGGINITHNWGITFHPCPDTNCEFDRNEADRKYEEWKKKVEGLLHEHTQLHNSLS